MMGTGEAEGDDRALIAAQKAIANPLLDGVSMNGAKGVIVSITGGEDMRLLEVDEAANHIRELVDPDANIIWGSAFNPELEGRIRVSVVATGIDANAVPRAAPALDQTRVFSFSTPRRTTAAEPVAAAPEPGFSEPEVEPVAETAAPIPEAYEPELEPVAELQEEAADPDELVLGADTIVSEEASLPSEPEAPAVSEQPTGRRRWLTGGSSDEPEPEPEAKPARGKIGGTLFERMASASRGAKAEEEDKDPLDIPRFLRSQNNQ